MSDSAGIRRQVYLLTTEDLERYPLWEFCSDEESVDGQNEATVRPLLEDSVHGYSPGGYILATDFVLADGSTLPGYIYSGKPEDLGCLQPNIVLDRGQICFWLGLRTLVPADLIQNSYKLLRKSAAQTFPIWATTRRSIAGSKMSLKIEGFMAMEMNRSISVLTA